MKIYRILANNYVRNRDDKTLANLHEFLNASGIKRMKQKYPFDLNNKLTWKVLTCETKGGAFKRWIYNPKWRYKDNKNEDVVAPKDPRVKRWRYNAI